MSTALTALTRLVPACLALLVTAVPVAAADAPPTPPTPAAGAETKPFLGIQVDTSRPQGSFDPGVVVSAVIANSTAETLKIQAGDVITAINDQAIAVMDDLQKALAQAKVGDAISVKLLRKNEPVVVSGKLQAKPAPPKSPAQQMPEIRSDLEKLKNREPSLAETLDSLVRQLEKLEKDLPKAAAAFKKQYPKGEFKLNIEISISSDTTATDPVQLGREPKDEAKTATGAAPRPAPEAPKPAP